MDHSGPRSVFALHSGGCEDSQQYGDGVESTFDEDHFDLAALNGVNRGVITDTDAFVSSLDPQNWFDPENYVGSLNPKAVVLVEPLPMIKQHSTVCEVMFELKQQEVLYEIPSGIAALYGMGRTQGISVDVGADLIQCHIVYEAFDLQAVFNEPVQCKEVGSSDFELPDGALVPTLDLIQTCKSSLPPGLISKFGDSHDRESLPLPRGIQRLFLSGLGLPSHDEEVLLWKSSIADTCHHQACLLSEHRSLAYLGGQVCSGMAFQSDLCGFSRSDYEEQGANRNESWYPASTEIMNYHSDRHNEDMMNYRSFADFGQKELLHGQAASDWLNREPRQWLADLYVQLESLGKLAPKDIVELFWETLAIRADWEEITDEGDEGGYLSQTFFGMSSAELLDLDQLNFDQLTTLFNYDEGVTDRPKEMEHSTLVVLQSYAKKTRQQEESLTADLERVREAVATLAPVA